MFDAALGHAPYIALAAPASNPPTAFRSA